MGAYDPSKPFEITSDISYFTDYTAYSILGQIDEQHPEFRRDFSDDRNFYYGVDVSSSHYYDFIPEGGYVLSKFRSDNAAGFRELTGIVLPSSAPAAQVPVPGALGMMIFGLFGLWFRSLPGRRAESSA